MKIKKEIVRIFIILYLLHSYCSISTLNKMELKKEHKVNYDSAQIRKSVFKSTTKITGSSANTIVAYQVSSSISVPYYYPYLFKMGVIIFPETVINYDKLITQCDDHNCHFCNQLYPHVCLKCATGFFLKGAACDYTCPDGYITDILRGRCLRASQVDSTTIFARAYTKGSCENKCGTPKMADCSCSDKCKANGDCCYDYGKINCDGITDKGKLIPDCKSMNPNCELCDPVLVVDNKLRCNQCLINFYLYNGKCYNRCPQDTYPDKNNFICRDVKPCSVNNCSDCIDGSISKCKQCDRGYFLMNGFCEEKCPYGYRADRISWMCLEYPVFAWSFIYPSRGSCNLKCHIRENIDCTCDHECFLRGDCCQDIEEFCVDFAVLRRK